MERVSHGRRTRSLRTAILVLVAGLTAIGCSSPPAQRAVSASGTRATPSPSPTESPPTVAKVNPVAPQFRHRLPGMPRVIHNDVYAAARAGMVSAAIKHDPAYLYVPDSEGAPQTTVIDQRTRKVLRVLPSGMLSQHVSPSWDLKTLYVEASVSDRLAMIDPTSGQMTGSTAASRPYNLYFSPDGRQGIVMEEQDNAIVFTRPHTFKRTAVVSDPSCRGPNHADFSGNGRYFVVTCEFSGSLLKVSTLRHKVIGRLALGPGSKPQDVRLSPDGLTFYVADMGRNLLLRVGWNKFKVEGATRTPAMPHGIYPSRDGKRLYVSDRAAGAVSVVSLATNKIVHTWHTPPGGTPDMGGVSADGKVLWLSGRHDGHVYGWDTATGKLIANIFVGGSPHGMLVWPQPGRYSLGHTGNMR